MLKKTKQQHLDVVLRISINYLNVSTYQVFHLFCFFLWCGSNLAGLIWQHHQRSDKATTGSHKNTFLILVSYQSITAAHAFQMQTGAFVCQWVWGPDGALVDGDIFGGGLQLPAQTRTSSCILKASRGLGCLLLHPSTPSNSPHWHFHVYQSRTTESGTFL